MSNLLRKQRIKPARETSPAEASTIEAYVDRSVPEKHKIATRRALLGQIPRSTAIRIKCLACCNFDREEVKHCPVVTCPLNPVRPYQDKVVLAAGIDFDEPDGEDDNEND